MMRQLDRAPRKARVDPPLLLAFLLPVFAVAPLAYPGYFELRSGFLPIFALSDRLAQPGDFSWVPAVARAYSLLGGDGTLPYWLATLPVALGADGAAAIKWVMAASLIAGSAGTFCWTRRRLADGWPALVASAVYILNPLTLSLVYREGAFAAVVFLGLMPWTLWATDSALTGRWAAALGLAALVAAAIRTQVALGQGLLAVLLLYALITGANYASQNARLRTLAGLAAGLLLGALLWLPAIVAKGFGARQAVPATTWLTLGLPWLALLAGWIAARLAAMLEPERTELKTALFGSLIALVLLAAYLEPRPVEINASIPPAPLAIFGDNEIALLAVDAEGAPGPNGTAAVDVTWQALRPLERDYTVFFHVVGPDGQRYGQHDTVPQDGKAPTSGWEPGRIMQDRYEGAVAPDAPIGEQYRYWLGWYDAATGQRLQAGTDDKYVFAPDQ